MRKGIGDGRVEGTGVTFDPGGGGDETRRFGRSTLDRFNSTFSSDPGLSGLFWVDDVDKAGECLSLVDETDPR